MPTLSKSTMVNPVTAWLVGFALLTGIVLGLYTLYATLRVAYIKLREGSLTGYDGFWVLVGVTMWIGIIFMAIPTAVGWLILS